MPTLTLGWHSQASHIHHSAPRVPLTPQPVAGDLVWLPPEAAATSPVGAPIVLTSPHVDLHGKVK